MSSRIRVPVWVRAGLWAALLSGAPATIVTLARGEDVRASTEAVGAVFVPDRRKGWIRVGVGAVAHLAISLFWARVLASLLSGKRGAVEAVATGAACGAGIALIDLGVIARFLPSIRELDGAPLFADHLAFGGIVAWIVHRERREIGS